MEQKVLFTRLKKIKLKAHTHIHTPSAMPGGKTAITIHSENPGVICGLGRERGYLRCGEEETFCS